MGDGRIVYSTGVGRVCSGCGWPARDCKCSSKRRADEALPGATTPPGAGQVVAKLRTEKKGRGGKTVTVLYDLPQNAVLLKELSQELKRACGTGGAVSDDTIELQGDLRDRVREHLARKGWRVKG
jgi:translation initiation factor 1